MNFKIDNLQYCNWSREIFEFNRAAGLDAVHVTIVYHEDYDELLVEIKKWEKLFSDNSDLIFQGKDYNDIEKANLEKKTAIFFGFQNCSPINDDLGLVQVLHELGARFMQLSYNNQSLLATGCYEDDDPGITRFGKQVIQEMNRVGMVIDMSHSAERSTLHAIELSSRPIAITHANPAFFHPALRNKSNTVIDALAESGGMLGLSLYPFHLKNGSACTLQSFCEMIEQTVERIGIDQLGIGSDLCQNWGYDTLEWMRSGRWTFVADHGEGSAADQRWPDQPEWFQSASDLPNIKAGLAQRGFSEVDINKIMGNNWLRFFEASFGPPATSDAV